MKYMEDWVFSKVIPESLVIPGGAFTGVQVIIRLVIQVNWAISNGSRVNVNTKIIDYWET